MKKALNTLSLLSVAASRNCLYPTDFVELFISAAEFGLMMQSRLEGWAL